MLPSAFERIGFFERDNDGNYNIFTWQFQTIPADDSPPYEFVGGEVLYLRSKFPFNKFDRFAFETEIEQIDATAAQSDLNEIKVFPNPYIVAHPFEPALPPSQTSGRGERRLYFSNIPVNAKIYIFTSRGEHLVTLENDDTMNNGTVTWDLKTKENLDIAFGIYFYVVESSVGVKKGKLAVIK
jgi:hypothetical protein